MLLADRNTLKLPSKSLRIGLLVAYSIIALVTQMTLLGVLGHVESTPGEAAAANKLFTAAMAVVGLQPILILGPIVYFGHQFLKVVTDSLAKAQKSEPGTDGSDHTAQIQIVVKKVCTALPLRDLKTQTHTCARILTLPLSKLVADPQVVEHCRFHHRAGHSGVPSHGLFRWLLYHHCLVKGLPLLVYPQ